MKVVTSFQIPLLQNASSETTTTTSTAAEATTTTLGSSTERELKVKEVVMIRPDGSTAADDGNEEVKEK